MSIFLMNYFIITYGCQMNESDSEKIATRLKELGYKPAKDAAGANLIVVNFCSVRQSAVHRALAQLDKYKNKRLIAAGCLLSADQKKLAAKNITIWHPNDYFSQTPLRQSHAKRGQSKFSAFVPIMTGCNNFCSYCAVPYTRGREKSRPAKQILNEVKSLIKKGYKEIVLLGQNVNSYWSPPFRARQKSLCLKAGLQINFSKLLKIINSLPGDFWLSFITSHPKDMSNELIETLAKCEKIIPYIHLPVQSGDDKVLRAMNRHYSVVHYKNLIKKLRASFKKSYPLFPPLAVSTDIIVGFPGETTKQFQNTLKLIKEINFDMIYFARYSPRPSTTAAKLKDTVPDNEKRRRAQAINTLLKQTALALNKKYIGRSIKILIEKTEGKFAFGKTITNKKVKLPRKNFKVGQFVSAKIIGASAWCLKAK